MIFTFYIQDNKTVIHFNAGGHRRSTRQRHNGRSKKFWGRCNLCHQRGHRFRECPHFVVASAAATAAATGTSLKAAVTTAETSIEAVTAGTPMSTVTAGTDTTAITSSTEIISTTTATEVTTSEAEVEPDSYNWSEQ